MSEPRMLPCAASIATVVRLVPDLDDELTSALARMEEFLLLIAAWTREHPAMSSRGVRSRLAARLHIERGA